MVWKFIVLELGLIKEGAPLAVYIFILATKVHGEEGRQRSRNAFSSDKSTEAKDFAFFFLPLLSSFHSRRFFGRKIIYYFGKAAVIK